MLGAGSGYEAARGGRQTGRVVRRKAPRRVCALSDGRGGRRDGLQAYRAVTGHPNCTDIKNQAYRVIGKPRIMPYFFHVPFYIFVHILDFRLKGLKFTLENSKIISEIKGCKAEKCAVISDK